MYGESMRPTLEQVRERILAGKSTKDEYGEGLLYEPREQGTWSNEFSKNGTPFSPETVQRIRECKSRWQSQHKAKRRREIEERVFDAVQHGPRLVKDVAAELGMDPRAIGLSAKMSARLETYYNDHDKLLRFIRVKQ